MHCVIRLLRSTWNRIGIVINSIALERNKNGGVGNAARLPNSPINTMQC